MNLLLLADGLPAEFSWREFTTVYATEASVGAVLGKSDVSVCLVTANPDQVAEDVLEQISDLVEVDSPVEYVVSRGIPGDVAVMSYDDTDAAYALLERLNKSGVTVLDASDEWVEVVLDKNMSMQDLVETITRRVTADVLRVLRAELSEDTPRRGRFRSPAPKV